MTSTSKEEEEMTKSCCEKFDPALFDKKEHNWNEKPFVQDSVWCFMYIPFNYGNAIERATSKINNDQAMPTKKEDFLCLDDMRSPWGSNIYVASTKAEVSGAEVVKITGKFLSKVYEGPYKNMRDWCTDMKNYAKEKSGSDPTRMYCYYATCPGCAEKYGKNYVVFFAQVEP